MQSVIHVFLRSAGALLFWSAIGFALSRRLAPAALAWPIAPAFGWAVHSALALPLYRLIGFTPLTLGVGSLLFVAVAFFLFSFPAFDKDETTARVPPWAY